MKSRIFTTYIFHANKMKRMYITDQSMMIVDFFAFFIHLIDADGKNPYFSSTLLLFMQLHQCSEFSSQI